MPVAGLLGARRWVEFAGTLEASWRNWQTQWIQNPPPARAYRFDSDRGHCPSQFVETTDSRTRTPIHRHMTSPSFPRPARNAPVPVTLFAGGRGRGPRVNLDAGAGEARSRVHWSWHFFVAGLLFIALGLAYGNSFQGGWTLDNKYIIELDPRTKAHSWNDDGAQPGVKQIFVQDYWWPKGISGLYRPITSFTYWLNCTALGNGRNTAGFHWVNLIVHWCNALMLYYIMLRLVGRWWVAVFTAFLFGLHPVATESVTNIIGRADLFAAAAVMGG